MPGWSGTRPNTRAQRAQRLRVLAAWPTCHLGHPGCTRTSTEDDHVIPLSQGGTDAWDNHRGVCHHCHTIKSQGEAQAARPRRRRPPEQHPNG